MAISVPEPATARCDEETARDAGSAQMIAFYMERRGNLVRLFAAKLESTAAAEDLVQDIYIKLTALKLSAPAQNPMALLYQIGSNLMLDRLRQQKRGMARDGAWSETRRRMLGGEEVADEPSAYDALAARQRLLAAAAAIEELPPRMRQAFCLHRLDGLSQAETAKAMGVSTKAIEKHISAALKILARALAPHANGRAR
jgi:RNA polymerase sigma-70 factor (ECF subfamily)